jgi:hypothetical protein
MDELRVISAHLSNAGQESYELADTLRDTGKLPAAELADKLDRAIADAMTLCEDLAEQLGVNLYEDARSPQPF